VNDQPNSGISYATWQDRQLAIILERTERVLRELRESGAAMSERNEALARELGRAVALLEMREAELRRRGERETALESDVRHWQARAAALSGELEREKAARQSAENAANAVNSRAIEKDYENEIQGLAAKAGAAAVEAAGLRRALAEIHRSLSWKITAPLRFLTKPFFRALAPPAAPAAASPAVTAPAASPAAAEAAPQPGSRFAAMVEALLPELRRAESIAIVPCAIPFGATLNQRPISCARYLADHGTTVLYVAWQWNPDEEVPQAGKEVYPRVFQLPLYAFQENLTGIASASYRKSFYLCTLPSPALVEAARPLRAAGYHIHYDIMDDWEGFHGGGEAPWFSAGVERELVALADTVTAVSGKLAEKFAPLRSDIAVLRNGYQPAALACDPFVAARTPPRQPRVVGYFGHFSDAWFDWDTVVYAARKLPGVNFELIGWGVSDATRARLDELSNIRLLGIVPQNELHRHARDWWAGMIPFQPGTVSAAVDPLKIYEYLHLGLNTVVTGISGIADYPLVRFADNREGFVAKLEELPDRPPESSLAEVAEFLKTCTWEERFARLDAILRQPAGLEFLYAR